MGFWRGNQQGCPEEGSPQRPHGWSFEAELWYSLLPFKFRKTGGIEDIKSDSYSASKIQAINTSQWEDSGNAQGATSVIRRLVSIGDYVYRPANPTRVTSVTVRNQGTSPVTINPGSTATLPAVSSNLYDCTTWTYYYSAPSYDYVGYYASAHSNTTESKTVLAQSGSTATQNFAFDIDDDL